MKLVMTLLVRDEEDILQENLDFHLSQGVDFIIVTDNLSNDGTPGILEKYQRSGYVRIINESNDDYMQRVWVTKMARLAATEYGADWVINSDADEFWFPQVAGETLKNVFAQIPHSAAAVIVGRDNFPIVPTELEDASPFFERLTWRDTKSVQSLGLPLLPKVAHRGAANIEVSQGNHSVQLRGALLDCCTAPLSILHFPIRSYAQFKNKIQLGGAAYSRNSTLKPTVGATWRALYKSLLDGKLPEEFRRMNPSAQEFKEQVTSGRLQHDVRLRDFLRRIKGVTLRRGS